jgi:hypothetical protein
MAALGARLMTYPCADSGELDAAAVASPRAAAQRWRLYCDSATS